MQQPALDSNTFREEGVVWVDEEEDTCDSVHICISVLWLGVWPKRTSTKRDRVTHSHPERDKQHSQRGVGWQLVKRGLGGAGSGWGWGGGKWKFILLGGTRGYLDLGCCH